MEPEEEAKFITLQDGRRLAYREQGVTPPEVAHRTLLVLHGIASSRLAGMPGNQSEHTKLHESNNNPSTYRNEFLSSSSSLSSLLQYHDDDANDYRFHLSCHSSSV
jgi:hypothetical protein